MINVNKGKEILNGLFNRKNSTLLKQITGTTIDTLVSKYKMDNGASGRTLPSRTGNDGDSDRGFNYVLFPYNITLALFYQTPDPSGSFQASDEVSTVETGYQRVILSRYSEFDSSTLIMGAADEDDDGYPRIQNVKEIHFPKASADWTDSSAAGIAAGTDKIRGFGVFGDGTLMLWGDLTTPVSVEQGDVALFDEENLKVTIKGATAS